MIVPVFLTHIGCHGRCTYCNQGFITSRDGSGIPAIIDEALGRRHGPVEVGLFGGNIFGIDPASLRGIFAAFDPYREKITNFRISTKPVLPSAETLKFLKEQHVTVVELGIPTFNNAILRDLNRGHTAEDLHGTARTLRALGFQVALQFMVGLPGETWGDIADTVTNMVSLMPTYIRVYPLAILKETPLYDMYLSGRYAPAGFDEVVERALYIYLNALRHHIQVVKLGLTDSELLKEKIAAGFYHPAFGHIVKSEAFYRGVRAVIGRESMTGETTVELNKRDVTHLLGYRKNNIRRFADHGLRITWEIWDMPVGTFRLTSASARAEGSIFDAIPAIIEGNKP